MNDYRVATVSDEAGLKALFDRYNGEGYAEDKPAMIRATMYLTEFHLTIVMTHEGRIVGGISGAITPWMFRPRELIFQEYFMYVMPEHRRYSKAFIDEAECICRSRGVKYMALAGRDKIIDRFYKMQGYEFLESHYIKKVA